MIPLKWPPVVQIAEMLYFWQQAIVEQSVKLFNAARRVM